MPKDSRFTVPNDAYTLNDKVFGIRYEIRGEEPVTAYLPGDVEVLQQKGEDFGLFRLRCEQRLKG